MFKKKPSPKVRTKEEVDRDYSAHAIQIGHKSRLIAQLQEEIGQHLDVLTGLCAEAAKIPPPAPPIQEESKEEIKGDK